MENGNLAMSVHEFKTRLLGLIVIVLALPLALASATKPLTVYFVDVEGGQATLFVSPSGESMLVDAGWPGNNGRDAQRILAAAHDAGIKQIDYLVVTHYHMDHVGGVPQLAEVIPIRNFVDHGPTIDSDAGAKGPYQAYLPVAANGNHILAKPGAEIPVPGLNVVVLTAGGEVIDHALPGVGEKNPYCPEFSMGGRDRSENAQSIGLLVSYGKFSLIDLGDLPSGPGEYNLVCPNNKVGPVEVYLTTQHGYAESGAYFLVEGIHPIVAISDNGAHKGGEQQAFLTISLAPGLEGFWALHHSYSAEKDVNAQAPFDANLTDYPDKAYWIKLTALQDGTFTVTNQRNGESKTYHPR